MTKKPSKTANIGEDAVPEYEGILTGHFRSGAGYRCVRSGGSGDWLLIYTRAGEGEVLTAAHVFSAQPGRLLLCPPGVPHHYRTGARAGRWEILWAHFHPRPDWWDLLAWPEIVGWRSVEAGAQAAAIERGLREMHRAAHRRSQSPLAERLAMNALEAVLLRAGEIAARQVRPVDAPTRVVLEHIAEHLAEPASLATLAQVSRQSVARLTRAFRAATGTSVRDYVEELRLERARQLLRRTGMSVKEVSAAVGFRSAFYLSDRFRRRFGRSPRAYRGQAAAATESAGPRPRPR